MSDSDASCNEVSDLCPVEATLYGYRPNIAVNAALAIIFAICLLVQLGSICFFRVRTWSYTVPLAIGALIEVLGYVGRLMMNNNPWSTLGVSIQLICLIVAPSFVAAAISVTFKHIIVYCGPEHSLLRPRFVPWLMIGTDFIGIIIQFLGAGILAMAVTADKPDQNRVNLGDNIIIFGVAFQVFIMIVCGGYMVLYWRRLKTAKNTKPPSYEMGTVPEYDTHKQIGGTNVVRFRQFCWAIVFAFITTFIRCIYRQVLHNLKKKKKKKKRIAH